MYLKLLNFETPLKATIYGRFEYRLTLYSVRNGVHINILNERIDMGNKIEMVGTKFGRLTVIREKSIEEYQSKKRPCVQWYCNCDCGTNDVLVDGTQLRRGHVSSCGCYNKEVSTFHNSADLTGMRFGKLIVIKQVDSQNNRSKRGSWWLCQCECGNEKIARANSLKNGNTISCGCVSSKGEEQITTVLSDKGITFKTQYIFDDLVSNITGYPLRFDFAVLDANGRISFLIEYDGQQHFSGSRFSKNKSENEMKFKRTQEYDALKNKYCIENNIDIVRIPYTKFKQIEDIISNKLKEKEQQINGRI